jgi:hypothetical protein
VNGYTQKRRGAVEHLRDGRLTLLEYGAHDLILALADKETGIWWGSAKALAANCGAGDVSERQARHLLESLESNGYILRFAKKRGHGNYPILVNKYAVTFGAHQGMRLNAERTTDWRSPVYEHCQERGREQGEESGTAEGGVEGLERAPFREGDLRKEKELEHEKKQKHATAATASVQFSPDVSKAFRALGYEQPFGSQEFQAIWTDEYGQVQTPEPNWTDVMERTIVRCQSSGVKVPSLFFAHKRQVEKVEVEDRYHRTPL